MPKEVRARVRNFGSLAEQDLDKFIVAKLSGEEPARLVLNFTRSDSPDQHGIADHVRLALLSLGAFRHRRHP